MHVRIDPELRDLLPAACKESRAKLKAMIEDYGIDPPDAYCPDNGHAAVLLDGHTRYLIWCEIAEPKLDSNDQKNVSLFFNEHDGRIIAVNNKDDAKRWILDNQLGRRNLTEQSFSYLIGKRYEMEKKEPHRPEGSADKAGKNYQLTAEKLAEEHGVSEKTVRNAAEYAEDVDALGESLGQDVKADILSGATKATKKAVKDAAQATKAGDVDKARAVLDKTKHMTEAEVGAAVLSDEAITANIEAVFTIKVSCIVQYLKKEGPSGETEKTMRGIKKACKHYGAVEIAQMG